MPKITQNQTGGVIRWDAQDWLAGLVPHYTTSYSANNALGKGFTYSLGIDPFRRMGSVSPGVMPQDATNISSIDNVASNGVANGSTAYIIAGAKVHTYAVSTNTISSSHTITAHGGHTISSGGSDVVLYNIGSTKYLFYSWSDDADGDIGRFDLASTFVDNWMSTVPTSAAVLDTTNDHPMIVGADDVLYIADGRNLHAFDGQTGGNGTLTKNKLVLPQNTVITCFTKTQDNLVIFGYKKNTSSSYRTEAVAYFWNYVDADPVYAFVLDGNIPTAAFRYNGTIGCFLGGRSSTITPSQPNKLSLFDGTGFKAIKTFPQSTPSFGGVEVTGNVIYWNSSGELLQYGSPYPGEPAALNRISAGGDTNGMLKNFTDSALVMSSGISTGKGLQKFSSGYYSSSAFLTPLVELDFSGIMSKGKVTFVKVYFADIASGGNSLTLKLNCNRGQTLKTVIESQTVVTEDGLIKVFSMDSSSAGLPQFSTIGLDVSYVVGVSTSATPPIIQAVEVYYDIIKI